MEPAPRQRAWPAHPVRELLRHMVSISDNTASDALLALVGGPTAVATRLNIRIDCSEKQMAADLRKPEGPETYALDARDTATPDAMLDLLVAFWQGRDVMDSRKKATRCVEARCGGGAGGGCGARRNGGD